jgi:hypothetical protein
VDLVYAALQQQPLFAIVHRPQLDDTFAPGYYSVLAEDPDGTRLEFNHVPGKGLFAKL